MQNKNDNEKLSAALLKRATGYWVCDEIKEYVYDYSKSDDGRLVVLGDEPDKRIVKSKTTKHFVPPDLAAIKMLLELQKDDGIDGMTEEELVAERDRLIGMLSAMNN